MWSVTGRRQCGVCNEQCLLLSITLSELWCGAVNSSNALPKEWHDVRLLRRQSDGKTQTEKMFRGNSQFRVEFISFLVIEFDPPVEFVFRFSAVFRCAVEPCCDLCAAATAEHARARPRTATHLEINLEDTSRGAQASFIASMRLKSVASRAKHASLTHTHTARERDQISIAIVLALCHLYRGIFVRLPSSSL